MIKLKEGLKALLPRDRYQHSLRVESCARRLARRWKVSEQKAALAALLHDCARYLNRKGMLKTARVFKFKIDKLEKLEPKLLHARLSAEVARRRFKIKDKQILSAIAKHTVGAEDMTKLDKIIYLADHIEAERNYHGLPKVRRLAFRSLNRALAASTSSMIFELLRKGLPIFEGTVKTRNRFLMGK